MNNTLNLKKSKITLYASLEVFLLEFSFSFVMMVYEHWLLFMTTVSLCNSSHNFSIATASLNNMTAALLQL